MKSDSRAKPNTSHGKGDKNMPKKEDDNQPRLHLQRDCLKHGSFAPTSYFRLGHQPTAVICRLLLRHFGRGPQAVSFRRALLEKGQEDAVLLYTLIICDKWQMLDKAETACLSSLLCHQHRYLRACLPEYLP